MKKAFFSIICLVFLASNFFAQTAVIECNTAGESCTNPNPEVFITYTTRVIDNGEAGVFSHLLGMQLLMLQLFQKVLMAQSAS